MSFFFYRTVNKNSCRHSGCHRGQSRVTHGTTARLFSKSPSCLVMLWCGGDFISSSWCNYCGIIRKLFSSPAFLISVLINPSSFPCFACGSFGQKIWQWVWFLWVSVLFHAMRFNNNRDWLVLAHVVRRVVTYYSVRAEMADLVMSWF